MVVRMSFSRLSFSAALAIGLLLSQTAPMNSQSKPGTANRGPLHALRDGQHDFDFNWGTWKTHVARLLHPLSGSSTWAEYDGVSVVSKVWNGDASLFELEVDGPAGHIEGVGLRLYNPQSHQWSLNWASSRDGVLETPMVGEFKNGRGEFHDQEMFNGRAILVRNSFLDITPDSSRFEQAFSDDGGKNWETNWVITFTRPKDETGLLQNWKASKAMRPGRSGRPNWSHDFDWEIGTWKLRVGWLLHPLPGSTEWVEMNGTVSVKKIWNGRANLADIQLDGAKGHIECLSLRLYNPQSHQWSMSFATDGLGTLSVPMIGEFRNGRGEFYDQESFDGRAILVRLVFSGMSQNSGHTERAFSDDGGKTWEVNRINAYTRANAEPNGAK